MGGWGSIEICFTLIFKIGIYIIGPNKLSRVGGWVGGGWVAGSNETKANSAQFQVKLPTGAELGNITSQLITSDNLKRTNIKKGVKART